jgi:hypothetical protein
MPQRELKEFQKYWEASMKTEINSVLTNRPVLTNRHPGGKSTIVDGVKGVDYLDLISWCKGNSVSVDQRTLQPFRKIFDKLIMKARERITVLDQPAGPERLKSMIQGVTRQDIVALYGRAQARGTGKVAPGTFSKDWLKAEHLFINLLADDHIQLYKNKDTMAIEEQTQITNDIIAGVHQDDSEKWAILHGICAFLAKNDRAGGHLRLKESNGWETYIRDHWGAPPGTQGYVAGSLSVKFVTTSIMPIPLHLVYAETLARAMSGKEMTEWGKTQSKIHRDLADKAAHHPLGDRVNLNTFYANFTKYGVGHMADTYFLRSVDDNTAARFVIEEIPLSEPKEWVVIMEPEFMRWRELQRSRTRSVGGEDS